MMAKIKIINQNIENDIEVEEGKTLLDVIKANGYLINAACGGKGTCQKCLVEVNKKLALACQTKATDNQIVTFDFPKAQVLTSSVNNLDFKVSITNLKDTYGIAIDLGTTTIALYLINLATGEEIDAYSEMNAQITYGSDVITRIEQCNLGQLVNLHQLIIKQINKMINYIKSKNNISEITKLYLAGNPTMTHLFMQVNPSSIGVAPYEPVFVETKRIPGASLKINSLEVVVLPSISGYLGGDIVGGIITSGMLNDKYALLIDIGTNGEIILKANDKLFGCSTAAGPAFEGAKITYGMGAVTGAIAQVTYVNQQLKYQTIDGEAKGLCGSGLIDLMAILVQEGIIDETGSFDYECTSPLRVFLAENQFKLANIYLTQKDIREVQLAKSAISAGIMTLIDDAKINIDDIEKVYLAGGFAFYLNKLSAIQIGLIPKEFIDKIVIIGNSSGLGAKVCMLNPKYLTLAEDLSKQVNVIDLSTLKTFSDYFIEKMMF